jgi:hypothetical protein
MGTTLATLWCYVLASIDPRNLATKPKRRRAETRLPPHSKFFRQTCESVSGSVPCLLTLDTI